MLDTIQDPGNLGTIIRCADWFGISTVICSRDSADVFNPKVVQSTMAGIARVRVLYEDLPAFLQQHSGYSRICSHVEWHAIAEAGAGERGHPADRQ